MSLVGFFFRSLYVSLSPFVSLFALSSRGGRSGIQRNGEEERRADHLRVVDVFKNQPTPCSGPTPKPVNSPSKYIPWESTSSTSAPPLPPPSKPSPPSPQSVASSTHSNALRLNPKISSARLMNKGIWSCFIIGECIILRRIILLVGRRTRRNLMEEEGGRCCRRMWRGVRIPSRCAKENEMEWMCAVGEDRGKAAERDKR